jgi:hypothetical protein
MFKLTQQWANISRWLITINFKNINIALRNEVCINVSKTIRNIHNKADDYAVGKIFLNL